MFDADTETTVPVQVDEQGMSPQELDFFDGTIRKVWHRQEEEWYFSIVDVVEFLSESTDPKQYIKKMRQRDPELNANWGTFCTPVQMIAKDGKKRRIQAAKTEHLLRIIQSISSSRAEPFKLWLAKVGAERLDEMADPEKALDRGMSYYKAKGYTDEWIKQRLQSKSIRDELTDEWKRVGISDSKDYSALTNILTAAWSGKTVQAYKQYKGLHKENLRDNMTNIELTLNQLAEVSATALSKAKNPTTLSQSKEIAKEGGGVAKTARKELEAKLGQSVISPLNATNPASLEVRDP